MKRLVILACVASILLSSPALAWSKLGQQGGINRLIMSNEYHNGQALYTSKVQDAENDTLSGNIQSCNIFGASSTSTATSNGNHNTQGLNGTLGANNQGSVVGECNYFNTNNHN